MNAPKAKALNDTQIKFLLRVEQGAVRWAGVSLDHRLLIVDDQHKWSMNTLDAMIRRGYVAHRKDSGPVKLTALGERMAHGLRSSWPHLAKEVA